MDNAAFSIGISILFIIIAALFLLSDFDAIEKTAEHQLPKKYEWTAGFQHLLGKKNLSDLVIYLRIVNGKEIAARCP